MRARRARALSCYDRSLLPDPAASPASPALEKDVSASRRGDETAGVGTGARAAFLALAALLGCLAYAAALALRPLGHDDLFWHLRSGEWIVSSSQSPRFA